MHTKLLIQKQIETSITCATHLWQEWQKEFAKPVRAMTVCTETTFWLILEYLEWKTNLSLQTTINSNKKQKA